MDTPWDTECRILFLGYCDFYLVLCPSVLKRIVSRAYILYCFEVGYPNLESGYMSGCQSAPYCFGVTLTLTSGISPILLAVGIPNLVCRCILGLQSVTHYLYITLTLTSGLICENVLSMGTFCDTIHDFAQTVRFKSFYRSYNPFLTLKKRSNCIKPISTLSLSTQHPIQGKTNSFTSQSGKPLPYDCTSV